MINAIPLELACHLAAALRLHHVSLKLPISWRARASSFTEFESRSLQNRIREHAAWNRMREASPKSQVQWTLPPVIVAALAESF